MNIYHVVASGKSESVTDFYQSFLIISDSAENALEMAKEESKSTNRSSDWKLKNVERLGDYIGDQKEPFILMADFYGC